MTKKIIKYPDPSLRQPTRLVNLPLKDDIWDHIKDLQQVLREDPNGLALASNQIMENGYRLFVTRDDKELNEIFPGGVCLNPIWKRWPSSKLITDGEGCLSFPGMFFDIPRWDKISVKFQDIDGNLREQDLIGLYSRMMQHEVDHLEGKLFIEQLERKKQVEIRNQIIRLKKAGRW